VRLPVRCPHHRKDAPTFLIAEGSEAEVSKTLLRGRPSEPPPATIGPVCGLRAWQCEHDSCAWIRHRTSRPTNPNWRWSAGRWVWDSAAGEPPYTFTDQRVIRCPHCRVTWQGKARRLLARQLRALGDDISRDVAEDLIG